MTAAEPLVIVINHVLILKRLQEHVTFAFSTVYSTQILQVCSVMVMSVF